MPDKQIKDARETRRQIIQRRDPDSTLLDLPPVECGHHLIELLYDIGPMKASGMGVGPISYGDILEADMQRGLGLTEWESQTLRHLSRSYSHMVQEAKDPNMPAPRDEDWEPTEDQRQGVAKAFRALASQMRPQ